MIKKFFIIALLISANLFCETSHYPYQFEGLFEDIYNVGPYNLIEKMIDPDDTILEAGGFNGDDTIKLVKMVPYGRVLTFEPNPPRYAEIVEKIQNISNASVYPYALGEKNGTALFYVCYGAQYDPIYEGASSLLPPSESMEINYQGPRIEVPCYVLDDFCNENDIKKIDFMWLDLEGYELQVLKSSPTILNTVKSIYVETNFYEFRKGMTQFSELKEFLEKNGFLLLSHGFYVGLQGNAIFVKTQLFDEIVRKIESKI